MSDVELKVSKVVLPSWVLGPNNYYSQVEGGAWENILLGNS